jgi:hypothetical protein
MSDRAVVLRAYVVRLTDWLENQNKNGRRKPKARQMASPLEMRHLRLLL